MEPQAVKLRRNIRIERRVGALAAALCAVFGAQAAETGTKVTGGGQAAAPQSNVAASTQAQPVELNPIVVTATRNAQRRDEVASSMEVVEGDVLEETVGNTFLDQLKKNASVDVIQYPNGLAGVGLRGMRPNFEFTINPRTLILIDGRPSGSTSFTTLSPESIERVEVLKGPASSLYGASAMGGVVNIITRRSTGPIGGSVSLGYGSFDTRQADVALGGSLSDRTDFDLAVGYVNQHDDFRTGGGDTRPNSDFRRVSGKARLGSDLTDMVRVDVTLDWADLDNNAPGPLSYDPPNASANETSRFGGDVRFMLTPQDHEITAVAYASRETYNYITVPAQAPRYRSSRTESSYAGLQLQDVWSLNDRMTLTYGVDWQRVEADRFSFNEAGESRAPYSPNERRDSRGVFAEWGSKWLDDRLIFTLGGRVDWIDASTLVTPYKDTFTPGSSSFTSFNPRGGVVYKLTDNWRVHGSAGTAFAPPQGSELAGENVEYAGIQRRLSIGNAGLNPERSKSWDLGVGYADGYLDADLTYFQASISDRIRSVIVSESPTERISSYENADDSRMRGIEARLALDAGRLFGLQAGRVGLSTSLTRLIQAEDFDASGPVPIRNVAKWKGNVSLTVSDGQAWWATLTARHVDARYDNDNSQGRIYTGGQGGLFKNEPFTVVDFSARWKLTRKDTLRFDVSNLFDRDYYEKADYTMPGRAFYLRYTRTL
ncbi:hemoglobin/transferrin/lactoferrin receptor protein/vitamin B12 transporter [Pusillimonas noertemannii]|uniref:Hemoglobin/transferrin/lactoferrin receptor protein/vitamin B12 transporter n=1 Tax=Pusillimonas noertemannii TaxID=305977 RepID=A0A2U1CM84_9BURK|nr:TonB-dependent receptor [Pusillimonas noertemannii]PVY62094.1 hemoglobin/transferrin/lactoferrin receptor protein/vitamin B12 transporter [Pusillimonas noertemannii]TFL10911.1 TonB-dependent receptor [Pusillimonas noertemannii]